jgi:hypothetical protein
MLIDYDSLVNELSSVLSKCRLTAHRARVKALSTWLSGVLLLGEASLSGMGRGATLLDEQKTFSGQLKRAFRFLNNPPFDPWEVGNALFGHLTQGLKGVLIAVDWTHHARAFRLRRTSTPSPNRASRIGFGFVKTLAIRHKLTSKLYQHKRRARSPLRPSYSRWECHHPAPLIQNRA